MNYFKQIKTKNTLGDERPMDFCADVEFRYNLMKKYINEKEVLDIGSGLGCGANFMALNGAKNVMGIDKSFSAIRKANEKFKLINLKFVEMDVLDCFKINKRFDVISAFEIIEHLSPNNHFKFLKNIKKILKKDGILVLSTPNKEITSSGRIKPLNPYHQIEYTYFELKNLISKVFNKVEILGLVTTNQYYVECLDKAKHSLKKQFLNFIFQFKIIHFISSLLPQKYKNVFSKQNVFELKASDFRLTNKRVECCENFVVLVKK